MAYPSGGSYASVPNFGEYGMNRSGVDYEEQDDLISHSDMGPKYRRKLVKQSKAMQPRSRASIQGMFSASASTISLRTSRIFGRASHALSPLNDATRSNIDLIRSAFGKKASEEMAGVEDMESNLEPIAFMGRETWKDLDLNAKELHLDLFRLQDPEDPEDNMLPAQELSLLLSHRNLRVLKITGMLQSYQKCIWQLVWMNPKLEVLELEMALEPEILMEDSQFRPIQGEWTALTEQEAGPTYFGDDGEGILHHEVGFGEYLDKYAIEDARMVVRDYCKSKLLSIVKLSLSGFVVDAEPIFKWFNPRRLRAIEFKRDCVDAGFALPAFMEGKVAITWPRGEKEWIADRRKIWSPEEVIMVELKNKKRVRQWQGLSTARQHLLMEAQANEAKEAVAEQKAKAKEEGEKKGKGKAREGTVDDEHHTMKKSGSQMSFGPSPSRRRHTLGFLYGGRRAIFPRKGKRQVSYD